ncbi:hypothetical protein MOSE0_N03268 [Monosporozyma servazzii]
MFLLYMVLSMIFGQRESNTTNLTCIRLSPRITDNYSKVLPNTDYIYGPYNSIFYKVNIYCQEFIVISFPTMPPSSC